MKLECREILCEINRTFINLELNNALFTPKQRYSDHGDAQMILVIAALPSGDYQQLENV